MSRLCLFTLLAVTLASTTLAQGRGGADRRTSLRRSTETHRLDLEFELKRLELEAEIAAVTAEDAQAQVSLAELQLARARENGEGYSVATAEIEFQRAKLRSKAQQLRGDMARLQLERAKAHAKREFENLDKRSRPKATASKPMPEILKQPAQAVPVQFEVLDGAKTIIIRGPLQSVQRVRQMIEAAAKAQR
ncbi:MAG: hypothetical protein AAFU85_19965 [Planctomycetota bacterium]